MSFKKNILIFIVFTYHLSFCQTKKIDSLKLVLGVTKEDTSKINILNQLASDFFYIVGDSKSALSYAEDALALAEKNHFKKGIRNAYDNMGDANFLQNNYAEARRFYKLTLTISEEMNDKKGMAYAYKQIGATYVADKTEKIKNYLQSLKIYREIEDKWGIAYLLHVTSVFYANENNYDEALKGYSEALKIREEIGEKAGAAQTLNTIGGIYAEQGKYDEALINFNKALKLFKELNEIGEGPTWGLPFTYICISGNYMREGEEAEAAGKKGEAERKFAEALKNGLLSLQLYEKTNSKLLIADGKLHVGTLYYKLKDYKTARHRFAEALLLSKQIRDKSHIQSCYLQLWKLDSLSEDYKTAFFNYKGYITYRDSLNNDIDLKKFEQFKAQNAFDKKEDSLRQKQIITQTKLDSQQKQKKFYLSGSVLLGLLSLFVFLNFRNQKKINKLAGDAHSKEKAELELQSLRAQLNPHFMFNSLNAIQELILMEENEKSQSYLARFAKLLRMLLENADKPFIPLQREIDFLRLYLALENLRIPDLQFSIVVDPNVDTEGTQIPNMILQPYIENAIWHGLSHKKNDRQLQIRISQSNGLTQYEIEDNGVGRRKAAELKSLYRKEHKSKGMELLSKRYKLLAKEYGSDIKTEITDVMNNAEVNGTLVSISVPHSLTYQSLQQQ